MNRGRRNNRNANTNRRPNVQAQVRGVKNAINGIEYHPRPDPTSFVQLPWNHWTYEVTGDITSVGSASGAVITPYKTTLLEIAEQITAAYGISGVAPVIKIIRAASWLTASQPNGLATPKSTTAFYEVANYNSSSKSKREVITDQGTLNMPAVAGYVYPKVDQKEVLDPAVDSSQIIMATTSDSDPLLVEENESGKMRVTHRVYVLWKAKSTQFTLADIE